MTLGVASIKGSYSGEVTFTDLVEPPSLTMRPTDPAVPGTIDTTVTVALTACPTAAPESITTPTPLSAAWSAESASGC